MEKILKILGKKIRISGYILYGMMILLGISACVHKSVKKDSKTASKPNVLVIMADQWRAKAFGHRGNPDVKTPNIDKLAEEGEEFMNATSLMPVCTPARASIMTGQRPLTNGVFMNDVLLDTNAVTVGKVMSKAGYHTAYIGKWHLNGQYRSAYIPRGNRRQGFQYWKVLECTHNYNHSIYYADTPDTLLWVGYDAIAQAKDASEYIKDHAKDKQPFFLFLSWGPPHNPYNTAPQEYKDLYIAEKIHLEPSVPHEIKEKVQKDRVGYYAHCSALDAMVGMLRTTLQESGIDQKTIIIFVSDHGDLLGNHGYYSKQQPYDESIRIPLIYYVPKALGGRPLKLDAMINHVDFMPTLLGLISVNIPDCVEGIDYSKYIRGGENPGDTVTLISCVEPFGEWDRARGGKEYRGLRSMRYTYVRDLDGPWLFFDNKKDPYQMNNLIGNKKYANLENLFDSMLTKKLDEYGDRFLPGMEYVKKWKYPPLDKNETVPYY